MKTFTPCLVGTQDKCSRTFPRQPNLGPKVAVFDKTQYAEDSWMFYPLQIIAFLKDMLSKVPMEKEVQYLPLGCRVGHPHTKIASFSLVVLTRVGTLPYIMLKGLLRSTNKHFGHLMAFSSTRRLSASAMRSSFRAYTQVCSWSSQGILATELALLTTSFESRSSIWWHFQF